MIIYIIPNQLPSPTGDQIKWQVKLPTVCLLEDRWRIILPVLYIVLQCVGVPSDLLLPYYTTCLKQYHCQHLQSVLILPLLNTQFAHGRYKLPSFNLLAEICRFQRKLACLRNEAETINEEMEGDQCRKVFNPDPTPTLMIPTSTTLGPTLP